MPEQPLGRRVPADFEHVEKYPLRAISPRQRPVSTPVVIGVNWYREFDRPVKDARGTYWVARDGKLTRSRGGHCVCLEPASPRDSSAWYKLMDQGAEGACVGFGSTRMMMLLNRKRYDAFWLYHEAQRVDEWPGEDYDGTSVRAALDVLRDVGHRVVRSGRTAPPAQDEGISANRWATSVDEVLEVLGTPGKDYVTVLNSWGSAYPHRVRLPASVLERLMREDGEVGLVVDR